jgi:hypothetical protein
VWLFLGHSASERSRVAVNSVAVISPARQPVRFSLHFSAREEVALHIFGSGESFGAGLGGEAKVAEHVRPLTT